MPTRNLSKLGGLQILVRCCVCLCVLITNMLTPKRARRPRSGRRASQCRTIDAHLVLTWSLCFICLQNSCMMLLTVVPLIWFACLLFVFFSERFPFICRAGFRASFPRENNVPARDADLRQIVLFRACLLREDKLMLGTLIRVRDRFVLQGMFQCESLGIWRCLDTQG